MTKWSHLVLPSLALLAAGLAAGGCTPSTTGNSAPGPNPGVVPNMTFPGPGAGLKSIMSQIGKGPDALWPKINSELNTDPPPWDDLKPQTEKLSTLAANVGTFEQAKGKETWAKDAKDFADLADSLKAAVQAKDLGKAKETQNKVHDACDACHQAHRSRPGGPPGG